MNLQYLAKAFMLLVTLNASVAHAEYLRIWRGYALPSLSTSELISGLNSELFPATAELAKTPAQLKAYQPVVSSQFELSKGLPSEIALLQYESEDSYKTYRATDAGKHYGDIHGDLFTKETSKSLIPETYTGKVEFERAYNIGETEINRGNLINQYRAWARTANSSDEDYIKTIQEYFERSKVARLRGHIVVVAKDYIFEYIALDSTKLKIKELTVKALQPINFELVQQSDLLPAKTIQTEGSGINFPVFSSSEQETVRDVWEHHFQAWKDRDLNEIVSDYTEQSVVIINDEIYSGTAEIRKAFSKLFSIFDTASISAIDRVTVERNIVYLLWHASFPTNIGPLEASVGTDTFVINEGKIQVQTVTSDRRIWQKQK